MSPASDPAVQRIVTLQRATGYDVDQGKPPSQLFWRIFHAYFEVISVTATGIVFILLFPFWFTLGHPNVTMHLCILMTFAQLFTSIIKDTVRIPRPASPPVVRIGASHYAAEMSFPSGHSSGALLLAYVNARYVNQYYFPNDDSNTNMIVNLIGVSYFLQVAFSRVYLGMHTDIDVLAGSLVGLMLALTHGYLGFDALLDRLLSVTAWPLEDFLFVAVITVALFMAFIQFHPTSPKKGENAFMDSARFVGAGLGGILGVWMSRSAENTFVWVNSRQHPMMNYAPPAQTWLETLAWTVTFMLTMVLVETVVKISCEKVVLKIVFGGADRKQENNPTLTKVYVWSRFWSHVSFSAALLFGAPYVRSALMYLMMLQWK